ncbi:MAG: Uma2 family endonuclease [Candidatus Eremiobacteraeota bacterium]|nr:Uma2 family endonuclease [Candidatus Eremiobacteraeota bacterium]MCW5867713.1 Uma2 family endonuclease [Candidatus Eremiobacteraeota bacterium]
MAKPATTTTNDDCWVEPDIRHLITEDDTPVDNPFHERQQNLFSECLHADYHPGRPYVCFTNVGLYPSPYVEALVPDLMLSMDVSLPADIWEKGNRAYLVWRYGKPPDLVIEVVSNRKGGEATHKLERYEGMRVSYYAIYDPRGHLSKKRPLRLFELRGGKYVECLDPTQPLELLGLKLALWDGTFQQVKGRYLRFADLDGRLLPTGAELLEIEAARLRETEAKAEQAEAKAEQAEAKAEQAEAKAEQAEAKAEQAEAKAEQAEAKAGHVASENERLKARLRELGIDPEGV